MSDPQDLCPASIYDLTGKIFAFGHGEIIEREIGKGQGLWFVSRVGLPSEIPSDGFVAFAGDKCFRFENAVKQFEGGRAISALLRDVTEENLLANIWEEGPQLEHATITQVEGAVLMEGLVNVNRELTVYFVTSKPAENVPPAVTLVAAGERALIADFMRAPHPWVRGEAYFTGRIATDE